MLLFLDPPAVDDNTPLTYTKDDIRLCTIQRITPKEVLGLFLHYHRHEHFHYIKLSDDYESTLAFRAGLRSFDRVIEYNGTNVEEESADTLNKKLDDPKNQFLHLLVCIQLLTHIIERMENSYAVISIRLNVVNQCMT